VGSRKSFLIMGAISIIRILPLLIISLGQEPGWHGVLVLQLCQSRHARDPRFQALNRLTGLNGRQSLVRYLDLADSKENKRAGRVGCTSVEKSF
jgi:hypothetical protein